MKKLLILFFMCWFVLSGCKKGEDKKSGMPGTKKPAEVVIPKEVRKAWRSVKIQLTDREKNEKKVYEIEIGSEKKLDDTGLTIEVLHFAPDFKMAPGEITSASSEPKNPAAQVVVKEIGKEPVKIWLFFNYPDVHAFVHPRYQLAMVGFNRSE